VRLGGFGRQRRSKRADAGADANLIAVVKRGNIDSLRVDVNKIGRFVFAHALRAVDDN
jgi:hypothetical protein